MFEKFKLNDYGMIRTAACSPALKVGDISYNVEEIIKSINIAYEKNVNLIVFPELCITGYSVGDLFFQHNLINKSIEGLIKIANTFKDCSISIVVGLPIIADNQLFNVGAFITAGDILGFVPKLHIPNYNEFYEKRWFASANKRISNSIALNINGIKKEIPFSDKLLFCEKRSGAVIGIEICEDLWVPIPPSSYHCQSGANIIVNLSASNETVGKSQYRRELVKQQSGRCITGYIYASSGPDESTTDLIFSGHLMAAENGEILSELGFDIERRESIIVQDIDVEKLMHERIRINSYMESYENMKYEKIFFEAEFKESEMLFRKIHHNVFTGGNISERIRDILSMQTAGLMKRLKHTNMNKVVVGISGGLDSTLALLVCVNTFNKMKIPLENITGITMPGFGTTGKTYNNAMVLMKSLGISIKEISIKEACIQHFKDIEQPEGLYDIAYENSQARERTQILMDYANRVNAMVIGTGNLSELALGWATYNGDHMSMYAVNVSIPKTLVKYMVKWIMENVKEIGEEAKGILNDVLNTPISPELIPSFTENGSETMQVTEKIIGDYLIHDFFIYYMLRYGFSPKKILFCAVKAFAGIYEPKELLMWLKVFYRRFFTNQFKRSCLPDGPKVGSVSLSPRGDWRMPSDASYNLWMNEVEELERN